MKGIFIPAARVRKEIKWLAICFAAAELLNIVSILYYGTSWLEVITQLPLVILMTVLFYSLCLAFRFVCHLKWRMFKS